MALVGQRCHIQLFLLLGCCLLLHLSNIPQGSKLDPILPLSQLFCHKLQLNHLCACDVTRTVSKPATPGVRCPLSECALSDFRRECWELVGQLCLQLLHLHGGGDSGLLKHGRVDSRTFKCQIIYKPFQTPLWVLPNLCLHTWRLVWASLSNRASPPWAPTVTAFDL